MYKHILIPIDGSELSIKALEQGTALATALKAKVTVLTVLEPMITTAAEISVLPANFDPGPDYRAEREQKAAELLRPHVERARTLGLEAEPVFLLDRHPAEGIIETAAERGVDLIVMSTHGRRGLRRLLLGSQTAEVLNTAKVAMLVVR